MDTYSLKRVLLTEGFYYEKFFSGSGKGEIDLQEWSEKWTEAVGQIEEAKRRGMKIYCKADCYATWQFGTMPYLP